MFLGIKCWIYHENYIKEQASLKPSEYKENKFWLRNEIKSTLNKCIVQLQIFRRHTYITDYLQ